MRAIHALKALLLPFSLCAAQSFDPNKAGAAQFDLDKVGTNKTTNKTYSNPISTVNLGDPFMLYHDGWYFFTYTTNDNITLKRSRSLTDNWDFMETKLVFQPNASSGEAWSTDLWAPELHTLNNKWYFIFTATPDADNPHPLQDAQCAFSCPAINHRMFVLESSGSDPWASSYTPPTQLNTFDQFAIDGTYFHHGDHLYHVYSCWEDAHSAWPANLCITQMGDNDPLTVTSTLAERTIISVPDEPWEQVPRGRKTRLATNEGPQQLVNPVTGQVFIIYSAARVNTPYYCLGLLELVGADPMSKESWRKERKGCVFEMNEKEGVYGPGHASFTVSPDGKESWVVYHAQTTNNPSADLYRTVRAQRFTWGEEDGRPVFPAAGNGPFRVPSGQ